jgi:hypothetical protein
MKLKIAILLALAAVVGAFFVLPRQTKGATDLNYFLIGVWAQPYTYLERPDNFAYWKSLGINTMVGHDSGPQKKVTEKEWDAKAKAAGLKVIRRPSADTAYDISQFNNGTLVAWMIPDEQDKIAANKGVWNDATVKEAVLDHVADMRKKAPQIPVTANFMGSQFGYGRNNWYKQAIDSLDFYSYDWYPFNTGYEVEMTLIERAQTITGWSGKYPMVYVETSDQRLYKEPGNQNPAYAYRVSRMRGPTPEEIRMEMAVAVTQGAPGILFFADSFYPFQYDGTTADAAALIKKETAVWSKLTTDPGTFEKNLPNGLVGRRRSWNGAPAHIIANYTAAPIKHGAHTIPANDYIILSDSGVVLKAPTGDIPSSPNTPHTPNTPANTNGGSSTGTNPPQAVTSSASVHSQTSATILGSVNMNNGKGTVWFEYGTSPTSLSQKAGVQGMSGKRSVSISASLQNLSPNTTYYYKTVAENYKGSFSKSYGSVLSFKTGTTGTTSGSNQSTSRGGTCNICRYNQPNNTPPPPPPPPSSTTRRGTCNICRYFR